MEYYVYQLRVEGRELPFYIGKGKDMRAWFHLTPAEISKGRNLHKKRTIAKALRENKQILVELVEENLSEAEAHDRERFWISHYGRADKKLGPLTNMTDGGEGLSGFIHSEETLQKLREAASGEKSYWFGIGPMKGKTHSEETKALMSSMRRQENNAFFGKTHTEENRLVMSLAKKGKPQVSEGFLGQSHSEESRAQIGDSCAKVLYKVTKPDGTIEIVRNMRKYCRDNNLTAPNMMAVAAGKQRAHKGHLCERMDE